MVDVNTPDVQSPSQGDVETGTDNQQIQEVNQDTVPKIETGRRSVLREKYNGNIEEMEKAYEESEKKIAQTANKLKELQEEYENNSFRNNSPIVFPNTSTVLDAERERYESEFGGLTYEQIMGHMKINKISNMPMNEVISDVKLELEKNKIRTRDSNFTEEVETKFDNLIRRLDPVDRVNPMIIKDCIMRAKGDSVDDIIKRKTEEIKNQFLKQSKPVEPSHNEKTRNGGKSNAPNYNGKTLTNDEIRRMASDAGKSVDEIVELFSN